ncbi:GDP-mannose 4,6-dehydratase [Acidisoma cellulosilyticum]|nr:GDP-mannose 4,6-dehydratase [Acidisoma cellulosilyticum]
MVTGATGFVGRHLTSSLGAAYPDAQISLATADITQADAISAEVRNVRPAFCIHLAGIAAVADAQRVPSQAWQVNLHGTLNLAHALRAHAPECLLIFASSADIYGASFKSGRPADEATLLSPLNTYAATKAAADLALGAMAAEGLRCVRVRAFNHTGPGQSEAFVVSSFARQVAAIEAGLAEPVIRVGNLDPERDMLDVRDVCAAYIGCIAHADALSPGSILNIASGTPRRVGDILVDLIKIAGLTGVAIETDVSRMRATDIPTACGNSALAAQLLGWQPRIPWRKTLEDVLLSWRKHIADQPV